MIITPDVLEDVTIDLRHRNQFILGPELPPEFATWKHVPIGRCLSLAVYLDLGLTQVVRDGRELTCIGYMLDPFNPQATEVDILDDLIDDAGSRAAVLERVSRLGGRWVLICDDGECLWLVNDAIGHRQVYFSDNRFDGGIWCASNPREIAAVLDAPLDEEAAGYLRDIQSLRPADVAGQRGRWWPGIGSPYAGIRHLTPNHYLDLRTKRQHRFWPDQPVAPRSLESAAEEGAHILDGMLRSARARFDRLTLMITRGLDSRLMLAACRPFAEELRTITLGYPRGDESDVAVPARLLPRLGLGHEVARASLLPSADFREAYEYRVVMSNDYYAANAEALAPFFERERVAITGIATGMFCGHYKLPWPASAFIRKLSPEAILHLAPEMEDHPFAAKAFDEWLDGLGDLHDHDPLDLFLWEQRTGNWHSDYTMGYDLFWKDCLAPMNCRYLYELLMGVDKPLREKPPAILHQRIMRILWPEVLDLADEPQPPAIERIKIKLRKRRNGVRESVRLLRTL